jgi:hypothetical protein
VKVKRKSTYDRRALSFLDRVDVVVVDVDVIDADEGTVMSMTGLAEWSGTLQSLSRQRQSDL